MTVIVVTWTQRLTFVWYIYLINWIIYNWNYNWSLWNFWNTLKIPASLSSFKCFMLSNFDTADSSSSLKELSLSNPTLNASKILGVGESQLFLFRVRIQAFVKQINNERKSLLTCQYTAISKSNETNLNNLTVRKISRHISLPRFYWVTLTSKIAIKDESALRTNNKTKIIKILIVDLTYSFDSTKMLHHLTWKQRKKML